MVYPCARTGDSAADAGNPDDYHYDKQQREMVGRFLNVCSQCTCVSVQSSDSYVLAAYYTLTLHGVPFSSQSNCVQILCCNTV